MKCPECNGDCHIEDKTDRVYNVCERCKGKGEIPDDNRETISKILDRCIHELGEHCQSVRIFVTTPLEDGTPDTAGATAGCGNLYAQIGQVREWMITQDEYAKQNARKETDEK